MIVLSLFDGMSCGLQALKEAGIPVTKYYASEIDKHTITVAKKNHPEIIHLGDVENWKQWNIDKPDLIIGGSPCQGFSFAGKQLAFDDPRSRLFFTMMEIIGHYKPEFRLLENVRMKKQSLDIITQYMQCDPVMINSSLVSAQNRVRYYWFNWTAPIPKDRGILLIDILEDKSNCVGRVVGRRLNSEGVRQDYDKSIPIKQVLEPRKDNKSGCLTTVQKDNVVIVRDKSKCVRAGGRGSYDRHEWDSIDDGHTRKLTVLECERLQTLPDNYTEGVSNTQRYKMLGNGWTVAVLAHLFKHIPKT